MAAPAKTVRFAHLTAKSGAPESLALWTAPEANRDFMKAVRENRVVTVVQENVGTRRDSGLVGFEKKPHASYFVFPKPLDASRGAKVIGIKYEQVVSGKPKGPLHKVRTSRPGIPMNERPRRRNSGETAEENAPSTPRTTKPFQAKPNFRFRAEVEVRAEQTVLLEIEARSETEARRLFKAKAEELSLDVAQARIVRKIGKVRKLSGSAKTAD